MRISVTSFLFLLFAVSVATAQNALPSNQSPLPTAPSRLAVEDLQRFQNLRAPTPAAPVADQAGRRNTAYPTTPVSFQDPQQQPESSQVPTILSGGSAPTGATTGPAAMTSGLPAPKPISMNQPLPALSTTNGLPIASGGSPMSAADAAQVSASDQETSSNGETSSNVSGQSTITAAGSMEASSGLRPVTPIRSSMELGVVERASAQQPNAAATEAPQAQSTLAQPQEETPRTASAATPMLTAPGASIHVNTVGPKSISVGKNATYEITVTNQGTHPAHQLSVTFATPNWIEIANTNLTSGTKEVLREADAVRMIWSVDRLEAGKSQRLILDVIPRKAQVFDLNVEWTLAPVGGAVQVQVTEPMLKMSITGPDEVQYGQTALFNVAIRNPGTGIAENVNISLSEALGGERANLGNVGPGEEKNLQVELIARSAGLLELSATVNGDGNLQDVASRQITVRRPNLKIAVDAPASKYAGTTGNFQITIENTGDAIAQDVLAAIGLPTGVQYISGIDAAERIDGGLRWNVGSLTPGAKRIYRVACELNTAGMVQIDAGVRGSGDLADATTAQTMVETLADLVLTVEDPKGPLPTGEDVTYLVRIANRGTKAATNLELVMHFSNGIEPATAEGIGHKMNPGEVVFDTIRQLDPNEEVVLKVVARAGAPGAHAYRAQLTCVEADSREMAGGTTKFFGDEIGAESMVPVSEPPADNPESPMTVSEQEEASILK